MVLGMSLATFTLVHVIFSLIGIVAGLVVMFGMLASDRKFYAAEYARPGHMKAGMEVFRAFPTDAEDFAGFAGTKLSMPMLVLSGEKAGGPFLIEQGKMVATNVEGVLVRDRGHWLMEEAPDQVIPKLVEFLNR